VYRSATGGTEILGSPLDGSESFGTSAAPLREPLRKNAPLERVYGAIGALERKRTIGRTSGRRSSSGLGQNDTSECHGDSRH